MRFYKDFKKFKCNWDVMQSVLGFQAKNFTANPPVGDLNQLLLGNDLVKNESRQLLYEELRILILNIN